MRIWLYLTLIVNCMIASAFLAYGIYTAEEQTQERAQDIREDVQNLAKSIAAGAANDLLSENFDNIEGLLQRHAALSKDIRRIIVTDAHGNIVGDVIHPRDREIQVEYDRTQPRIDLTQTEALKGEDLTRLAPIKRGDIVGWVQVTVSLSKLGDIRRHIWLDTLVAAGGSVAFAGIVLALVLLRVSRLLMQATSFAADLGNHRGSMLELPEHVKEINQLKAALNGLSQTLSTQFQQLQDSEARKQAILTASVDCMITLNAQGNIVDANPSTEQLFGYQRTELLDTPFSDLIVEDASDKGSLRQFLVAQPSVLSQPEHHRLESLAIHKKGQLQPVEITLVSFMHSGQAYFLASLRDIRERKRMEAEQARILSVLNQTVRDLEARQLALDEHAIVSIADHNGNIIYANDRFCQTSQYKREELLGKNHRIVLTDAHPSEFYTEMWNTISQGRVWHGDMANRKKNGELYWLTSTIVPMKGEDDQPSRYISIRTDITAQREMAEALREAQARELAIGNTIQRALLFGDVPARIGSFSLAVYSEPSKGIDGDFYDLFHFGPDLFDLSIGDVMGKGIPAALIGAAVKQMMSRVIAEQAAIVDPATPVPSPATLINALHEKVTQRLIGLNSFVTLAYFRFNLKRHTISFVDAGHTRAILSRRDQIQLVSGNNVPLGVLGTEVYEESTMDIAPGDLLFLYSDGLTEAKDPSGEEFGVDRLAESVRVLHRANVPVCILVQAVRQILRNFDHSPGLADDRTCIAVQLEAPCAHSLAIDAFELPWKIGELRPLRGRIATACSVAGLTDESRDELILAAFEATTNVVRHVVAPLADATLHVRIESSAGLVSVELHHLGEPFLPRDTSPDFSGESEGGFGLFIVRSCVDEIEYGSPASGVCRIRMAKHAPSVNREAT